MKKPTLILALLAVWPLAAYAGEERPPIEEALEEAEFQVRVADSRLRRDLAYPEALDPDHAIHAEAEKIWKDIERREHPLLTDPDAPFLIYQMAAHTLGIARRTPF
jgi:hypothetical protein